MTDISDVKDIPAAWELSRHHALIADALDALAAPEIAAISHLRPGLVRYLEDRIETGAFLRCVLENDLAGAISHTDPHLSMPHMKTLISVIYASFPSASWGSPEKVAAWLTSGVEL